MHTEKTSPENDFLFFILNLCTKGFSVQQQRERNSKQLDKICLIYAGTRSKPNTIDRDSFNRHYPKKNSK